MNNQTTIEMSFLAYKDVCTIVRKLVYKTKYTMPFSSKLLPQILYIYRNIWILKKKKSYKGRHQIMYNGCFWMVGFWVVFFLLICIL